MHKPKIAFLLPTNKPEIVLRHALREFSLRNLTPLARDYHVVFCLVTPPEFDGLVLDRIHSHVRTFQYMEMRHSFVSQETPVRMMYLRQVAAGLCMEAMFYFIWDDNMEACPGTDVYHRSSGERYLEAIDYMRRMPRCGAVSCVGPMGGNHQRWKIRPTNKFWYTDRGLIFRNEFEGKLFFQNALHLPGGFDDPIPGIKLIEHGYYIAKQFNNPTRHHLKTTQFSEYKENDHEMHERRHVNAIEQWILDRYNDPGPLRQLPSEGLSFYPPYELMTRYRNAGGLEGIYPKVTRKDLEIDYE